ncbi:hypothetical protein NpNSSI1_00005136 [Neofusicoccum parvum]|nr:hypothetical protein NpNSSI1_00005136 [Neofusicoccum parvum]
MSAIDDNLFSAKSGDDDNQSQRCWESPISLVDFEDFLRTSTDSTPSFDSVVSTSATDWANDMSNTCISPPATASSKSASPSSTSPSSTDHTISDIPTTPFVLDTFTDVFDLPDHPQPPTCACRQHLLATLSATQPPASSTTTIPLDKLLCANKTTLTAIRAALACPTHPAHPLPLTLLLHHLLLRTIAAYHEAWLSALAFAHPAALTAGRAIAFGAYRLTDDDDGGARALVRQIVALDLRRAGEVAEGLAAGRGEGGADGGAEVLAFLGAEVERELGRVVRVVEGG